MNYWFNSFWSIYDFPPQFLVCSISKNILMNLTNFLRHHKSILLKTSALAMATNCNSGYHNFSSGKFTSKFRHVLHVCLITQKPQLLLTQSEIKETMKLLQNF